MNQVAVLVDAGYFWKQLAQVVHGSQQARRDDVRVDYVALREQVLQSTQDQFPCDRLLRVYWYDGPSLNGSKTSSHNEIEKLDDFKLRLGIRSGNDQKQKAVDGLIIADLIGLAQSKSIVGALLLSGDADLTPGVIAAQALGIRVHLLSMGSDAATSPYLQAEVDCKAHWTNSIVGRFASDASKMQRIDESVTVTADAGNGVIYKEIAEKALQLLGYPDKPVVLQEKAKLPREADSTLLWQGKSHFKKDMLTESEKRGLRDAFRRCLLPPG